MGKGRDKRKKHEAPEKAMKRMERQGAKAHRNEKDTAVGAGGVALYGEENIEVTVQKLRKIDAKRKEVLEKKLTEAPTPRINACFIAHPTRDTELILFGGECWNGVETKAFNDLLIYNIPRREWSLLVSPGAPCPRSSSQAITYKHFIIIQGGEFVSQSQSQFLHFRDTWRLDVNTGVWEELKIKNGPSARSGHRIAMWKRQAVLFGGFYDNSLECKYFDDLWVLSDLDGVGQWNQILVPPHSEAPHQRSGHSVGIFNETFFVFGGYSTEKVSRMKKHEATVHHDLWSINLTAPTPVWQKLRLGGIPPPIRSGVGFVSKDKRLLLFGGVVDIDAPGGKTMSSFHNDLFAFHMDNARFFPLVLKNSKKGAGAASDSAAGGTSDVAADLAANLAALRGGESESESDDDDEDDDDADHQATSTVAAEEQRHSHLVTKQGVTMPCRRMNSMLCTVGHQLYVFGGQYEVGKKEVTLSDLFSLNLNRLDSYQVLMAQDLTQVVWMGKDSDQGSNESWEDGSTVLSTDEFAQLALEEEDDEDDGEAPAATAVTAPAGDDGSDDGEEDEIPDVVPSALPFNVTDIDGRGAHGVDGRTTIKGKHGMRAHKAQLEAQLGSTSMVPTPLLSESLKDFYHRTQAFWLSAAREATDDPTVSERQLKTSSFAFCRLRYDEATELMEQLQHVNEQQKQEDEWLRERIAEKRRRQAEEDVQEGDSQEEDEG